MRVHTPSTAPKGHAPEAKPYALDSAHPSAKASMKNTERDSSAYIVIMKVRASTPKIVSPTGPLYEGRYVPSR